MNYALSVLLRRNWLLGLLLCVVLGQTYATWAAEPEKPLWLKGNIHCHSLWSDGDDFPEMVAGWYKEHGYQFLAISDHNLLMRGERWISLQDKRRVIPDAVVERCRGRFGDTWVELRGKGAQRQVRLKTLAEVRGKLEELGKFLLIEAEEVSNKSGPWEAHIGAINLSEPIAAAKGDTVCHALRLAARAVQEQSRRTGRPMLAIVNHPSWRWFDVSADDLAHAVEAQCFEVCNNSPGANNLGTAELPSTERLWDIANAIRIAKLKLPPLCAVASDDAHSYRHIESIDACPGRGWIMVRAKQSTTDEILRALQRGDFYASTGIVLRDVAFDAAKGELTISVAPEEGVKYSIRFVGTLADCDLESTESPLPDKHGRPERKLKTYSPEIGKVLKVVEGTVATYTLTGGELYVRAVVSSDRKVPNRAESAAPFQQAWCQPVFTKAK